MPLTIATWNVFRGDIAGKSPLDRMVSFAVYSKTSDAGSPVDVICYQEVPRTVVTNRAGIAALAATGYAVLAIPQEYPGRAGNPPPFSQSGLGYIVLYNPARMQPDPAWDQLRFLQPANFMVGIAQGRPPVAVMFQSVANPARKVMVSNWHNEVLPALGNPGITGLHNTFINAPGPVVIAGDFNVPPSALAKPVLPGWTAVYNSVDYILTEGSQIQDMKTTPFRSDVHTAFTVRISSIHM